MEKLLLVYNPKSGDGRIRAQLAKVIEIFSNANYRVEVYATKRENDGMEWIEKVGCEFDRIVVCGGDGMFHEAVNGWFQSRSKAPLAYIPSGTVNDFANTHNIPKNDVEAATMIASDGMIDQIDAGLFNDTYFSYVAAFGFATSTACFGGRGLYALGKQLCFYADRIRGRDDRRKFFIWSNFEFPLCWGDGRVYKRSLRFERWLVGGGFYPAADEFERAQFDHRQYRQERY